MPQIIYRTKRWTERALEEWQELKPLISILFLVATLLGLVFVQMEERNLGYAILKTSRVYREQLDERRGLEIQLAKALRLEKLESVASKRLTLKKAQNHQVIYLNDQNDLHEIRPELALSKSLKSATKSKLLAKAEGQP